MVAEIFISYSSRDRKQVSRLVKRLEEQGVSVWFDQEGIVGADLWRQEIVKAIESCKVLVLIVTDNSVTSENVIKEVSLASDLKKRILPVFLEAIEIPDTLKYQLAGIHRIEWFQGEADGNFHRVLRSIVRLGIQLKKGEEFKNIAEFELPDKQKDREKVEEFQQKHRTGLVTLVFTDIVGFTAFKSQLGEKAHILSSRDIMR